MWPFEVPSQINELKYLSLFTMKNNISILLVSLLGIMSCQKGQELVTNSPLVPFTRSGDSFSKYVFPVISKEDALKIVEPITGNYPNRWVDISNEIIPAGTRIAFNAVGHLMDIDDCSYCMSPDYDSWLLVIDNDSAVSGREQQIHIFVDVESGIYSTMELKGRAIIDWDTSRNICIHSEEENRIDEKINQRFPERSSSTTRWAVIICGGVDSLNNKSRYYNDCVNIYSKLTQEQGYPKGNIFCLMSDGTDPALDQRTGPNTYISSNPDLDGDGTNDVQYRANKTSITSVFNSLSLLVNPGDEVLVFMTDHGGSSGCFYLWDNEALYPSQLNAELNKLGSAVMIDVVMGQCYSGAFISPLSASNRTIATSCTSTEVAWAKEYQYNYFLHYWTEHISYSTIYDDSYVTPSELFYSAYQSVVSSHSQHPQFISMPTDFGSTHSIAGEIIPRISGSNYLSTNTNSLYYIANNPNPSSVTWSASNNASLVSYTDSTAVLKGIITFPGRFCESEAFVCADIVVDGKTHHLSKNIESVWKPGIYIDGNNIWGSNGAYQVRHLGGEYGYVWQSDNPAWQIVGFTDHIVSVSEGSTSDPVNLIVVFNDPLGEVIVVKDCVH